MTTLATFLKCVIDAVNDFQGNILPLKDVFLASRWRATLLLYTGAQTTFIHFLMNI